MDQEPQQNQSCYFCDKFDMDTCINRSLYHKYNDMGESSSDVIDGLLTKNRSVTRFRYEEMQFLLDDQQNLKTMYTSTLAQLQFTQLREYYKYRIYVPVFCKSTTDPYLTDSIYYYYYQKLKIYYNQIKRNLNMTIEQTSKTEIIDGSLLSVSRQETGRSTSQILTKLINKPEKQSMRQYETQSKALENLVAFLRKKQNQLKKIKTLKTQDCMKKEKRDPFSDYVRNQKFVNTPTLDSVTRNSMKRKNHMKFYRMIEQAKTTNLKPLKQQIKMKKKSQQSDRKTKVDTTQQYSNSKLKKGGLSKQSNKGREKSLKKLSQLRQQCTINPMRIDKIVRERKSLPRVLMEFQGRPSRSLSSMSLKYSKSNNKVMTKILPLQQQNDYLSPYHKLSKADNNLIKSTRANSLKRFRNINESQHKIQQSKQHKNHQQHLKDRLSKQQPKLRTNKPTPKQSYNHAESTDNIISMRKKKLQQLKLKSNRKRER